MKKAASLIIIAGLLLVLAVKPISGICITPGPPCHEFWCASAVFVGRVVSVTDDTEKWPSNLSYKELHKLDPSTAVHAVFEVSEPFRGVSESKIEVRTGSRGPKVGWSEAFDFRVGQEYIVYAHRSQSGPYLSTSVCTRTSRIENAAEDWPMLDLWLRAPQPEPESSVRLFARLIPGRFKYHFGLVKRVGKLRPMRRAISSLLECPWVIIKSCFPAERNFPPVFWMSEVAHASDQSRMSWTDENHHLILTTLSAKAALVFSQLIRRGAKCRKEQETAIEETKKSDLLEAPRKYH